MRATASIALALILLLASTAPAAVPTPDHVVIVIEENHSAASILGNPDAPYLNSLAAGGASFTNFFAISHPSQPNYIQFFSGSSQGVIGSDIPEGIPFSTPNLGAALASGGKSFTGYSEDLPFAGYNDAAFGNYVRRHNPWANWQNDDAPSPNQLPSSTNQPFTAFPTNYSLLPTVSIVVPNNVNNMHDGSIADADTWLQSNIEPYRAWAMNNNSLLIVTWDEDEHVQNNQIPTIFAGPMVRTDQPAATADNWNLHNLLRTVEDMYATPHSGSGGRVAPITGIWTNGPPQSSVTKTFRQNVNGYTGAQDTYVESNTPDASHESETAAVVDGETSHGLIRFDNLFGGGANQIDPGTQILRAKLTITTGSDFSDGSPATMSLHRMLVAWAEGDSWDAVTGGIGADGSEALATADNALNPEEPGFAVTFDVTTTLQEWADGQPNHGWAILPSYGDDWRWNTSEAALAALRPMLEVTFVPEPAALAIALAPLLMTIRRRR